MSIYSIRIHAALPTLATALLLVASVTQAADNGVYLGASAGDAATDYNWNLGQTDAVTEDSGFKLIGGVRPLDAMAVEFDYVDFGSASVPISVACPPVVGVSCPNSASIDTRALSVSIVGHIALPLLDLFGRVGVSRWESELELQLAPTQKTQGTDPTYGLGAQLRLGSFALRLEYERFERARDSVDLTTFGFTYTFL